MKRLFLLFIYMLSTLPVMAITGDEILKKVDANTTADSKIITSKMIIHGRRNDRTITSKSWIEGTSKSFTEYLAPAREQGTKMLKLEDELWTYSPQSDRTIRIAGHMLRQAVMGSDLSYEDYMEDPKLINDYTAKIDSETVYQDRPCWVLLLEAKPGRSLAYHSRRVWIDKDRFIALRENRYAKSGKLLKTTSVTETKWLSDRWVPTHIIFKDVLKNGQGTEFVIEEIQFNQSIPEYIFSKASLRR